jgi:hypothetical protein
MVTMVMMLVISIIVLGFAQVSRREQRQSLDRQLSEQAFLAAESGINDARKVMQDALNANQPIPEKSNCEPDANASDPYHESKANPVIDDGVEYTCLLVSTALDEIPQIIPADGNSVSMPLHPTVGKIDKLNIKWKSPVETPDPSTCETTVPPTGAFPSGSGGQWQCDYGVLRMDIVPTDALTRSALMANQKAVFFYPTTGPTSSVPYGNIKGATVPMSCTAANDCNVTITDLDSAFTNYSLRFSSVYASGSVIVSANNAAGDKMLLKDAQAQVDVTGRAQDVLRRVQVRLALTPESVNSHFALQSGSSICKRFLVGDGIFSIPSGIDDQDDAHNPMCKLVTTAPPPPLCTVLSEAVNLNHNFTVPLGDGPTINEADAKFRTELPYRGPNVYPSDDPATTGPAAGYTGGFSIHNSATTVEYAGGYLRMPPFKGDPSRGIEGTNYFWYSNPNQSMEQEKGTKSAFVGKLWEQDVTVKPNTTYAYIGYFGNWIVKELANSRAQDPTIEFRVDGRSGMEGGVPVKIPMVGRNEDPWMRVAFKPFTTLSGQTSVRLSMYDHTRDINGDDFAMASAGLYECLN